MSNRTGQKQTQQNSSSSSMSSVTQLSPTGSDARSADREASGAPVYAKPSTESSPSEHGGFSGQKLRGSVPDRMPLTPLQVYLREVKMSLEDARKHLSEHEYNVLKEIVKRIA